MLCKNPYMKGIIPCPCNQCLPCRVRRAALWTQRLLLERSSVDTAAFVTLTYRDEELIHMIDDWHGSYPVVPNLVPKDTQDWLKRLRKVVDGKLRYYLVGEYGDQTGRPHYHVALFGFPGCENGRTNHLNKVCCRVCSLVGKTWPQGSVDVGELNEKTAAYMAGYVTKKLLKEDVWARESVKGRHPQFTRMSLRPGIGANAIKSLVTFGVRSRQRMWLKKSIDAPVVLKKSGSILPLGRYLRRKWREALGRSPDTPRPVLAEFVKGLQKQFTTDCEAQAASGVPKLFIDVRSIYFAKNQQKIMNLEKKSKIWQSKGKL